MGDRIARLAEALPADIGGVIITSRVNRRYFTGFSSSAGTLLVTRGTAVLFVDFRFREEAEAAAKGVRVEAVSDLRRQILDISAKEGADRLAIEADYMSVSDYLRLSGELRPAALVNDGRADRIIKSLRRKKDPGEVDALRRAEHIGDLGFEHLCGLIKPGITEKQIALELDCFVRRNGAERLYQDMIVASGARSSLPHGAPSDNAVAEGTFLTMDFGVIVDGYCSDMTRTVGIGSLGDEERRIYDIVLEAQTAAENMIRPGVRCADVDKAARDIIYGAGYKGCFGHGLGHSVGLENHEDPRFNETTEDVCQAGDVMSVEPGIYIKGRFGCRIEDLVFINEDGIENLTGSTKKLLIL